MHLFVGSGFVPLPQDTVAPEKLVYTTTHIVQSTVAVVYNAGAQLAGELDGGGVDVLANGAHVGVGLGAGGANLLGVDTILGVQVLHLTGGEDAVHAAVQLELGAK
eukprot:9169588-Pyramimonas_sp.AAC.1